MPFSLGAVWVQSIFCSLKTFRLASIGQVTVGQTEMTVSVKNFGGGKVSDIANSLQIKSDLKETTLHQMGHY